MVVAGVCVTITAVAGVCAGVCVLRILWVRGCVVREFTVFIENADAQYLVEQYATSSFAFNTRTCAGNSLLKLY